MNISRMMAVAAALILACQTWAQGFFTTEKLNFSRREGKVAFTANIEYPVSGSQLALKGVREWLKDILEVDSVSLDNRKETEKALEASWEEYRQEATNSHRTIKVERMFEDEDIVTFQSEVVDRDSEVWKSDNCASFSKADGHRIQPQEIFNCPESKVKELMWRFRGDLDVDATGPQDLVVGDAGYIDGWIVVIGPARGYTGAAYKIRYQVAEPYLKGRRNGTYYQEGQ